MNSTRDDAIARIERHFDSKAFFDELAPRIAIHSESQEPSSRPALRQYLETEMTESFQRLGFSTEILQNPGGDAEPPFMIARRHEGEGKPTVFGYGHGDVVRGYDDQWSEGLSPWRLQAVGDRWYGRGTADNKGQHSINMAAMEAVIQERGELGFNVVFLVETGEETGSPGLREFCDLHRDKLAADLLVASDGPRLAPDQPTVFMGTRGALNFDLSVDLRAGGHHSGNWGGLLANPGIMLAAALASLTTATGEILVPELRPPDIPQSVSAAVRDLMPGGGEGPDIDPHWGEPGLTPAERVYGWNSLEILAFTTGNPENPVNAIPPRARAHCQVRFVVPCQPDEMLAGLRRHLDEGGFEAIEISVPHLPMMASRLDPDHPWAQWAARSITMTSGRSPAVLPNLGGSLPNDIFADLLGLPTIWVPHSYPGCSQHAPDEHLLDWVVRDALRIMTGLYWDLGEVDLASVT